ncbi:YjfB family protein [Paenibacillus thalictri]|uniref:Putative motility protein n=1 Tax=Paenibacillus thalictri TaxID=2527873 RepID=A0A4Q9DW54_9BACL|nr:YjfB family protein [Paenibacillus thalictri]TBL81294.1 putative motility protein [Paenibacillus thalictri]
MDIAALSMQMKQSSLGDAVGVRLLSIAKDQMQQQGQELAQMLQQSVQPHLGGNIDIRL